MRAFAAVLLLAACGGKTQPAPAPPAPAVAALPDVPFDDLDHEQRKQFMTQKVVPAMKLVFQKHDAKEFADFNCANCHGPGVKEDNFEMPNPLLPKLNFKDLSKYKKEDLEWMKTEVMPTMARILGEEPVSEQNPKGFGCLECHTEEK